MIESSEMVMGNKCGLSSSKVAVNLNKKNQGEKCRTCMSGNLYFFPTMQDH